MASLESADHLPARYSIALDDRSDHRLERREHSSCVLDRDHRPIDDDSREVDDAISRRKHHHARQRRLNIDAAVTRPIGRRRGDVGPHDGARPGDGPLPARGGGRDSATGHEQQGE